MSRIVCKHANSPIIFVAPHGHPGDDYNTDYIAETAANKINANCLINSGFRRNAKVDESRDFADCNNVAHMSDAVLKDEFLLPFKRMCLRAKKNYNSAFVIFIHGVSDQVRDTSGIRDVDMILGYGLGNPDSRTCSEVCVNKFIYQLADEDIVCAKGKAGGKYSGHSKNNMNQYWRKIEKDMHMNSIQLEIVRELRQDKIIAELSAISIAECADIANKCTSFFMPSSFRCDFI